MLQYYSSYYKFCMIFFALFSKSIHMNILKKKKLSSIFSTEISKILNEDMRNNYYRQNLKNLMVTLIRVNMNPDINSIKIYISIYPIFDNKIANFIVCRSNFYRRLLSKNLRYYVKKIPKLYFHVLNN